MVVKGDSDSGGRKEEGVVFDSWIVYQHLFPANTAQR